MNLKECIAALEAAGSEQTRKTYARHGVDGPMFGVSFAFMGKLTKQIGTNHELALGLWESGNHDCRILAEFIMDPSQLTQKQVDTWAKTQKGRFASMQFGSLVAKTPFAKKKSEQWRASKDEWMQTMGWNIVGALAVSKFHCGRPGASTPNLCEADDPNGFSEAELLEIIKEIEARIAGAANMAKYAMNGALIAIGTMSDTLYKAAMTAGKRIGVVDVDHGNTSCKTPFLPTYLPKSREATIKRMAKQAGKKPVKKVAKKAAKKVAKKVPKKSAKGAKAGLQGPTTP